MTDARPPQISTQPDPWVAEALAHRERIYLLRGQIVSEVNGIESVMDSVISVYFVNLSLMAKDRFQAWVLRRVWFAEKVEIVKEIVNDIGIGAQVERTLPRLRRANDIRNDLAHSHVTVNFKAPASAQVLDWHSARVSKKKGMESTVIEIAALERDAAFVSGLEPEMFRIMVGLLAARQKTSRVKAIEEFDLANPDLAEAYRKDG